MSGLTPTAARALAAYGGEERWRTARTVELTVSAWGWAFRLKWRPAMRKLRARLEVPNPQARLGPGPEGEFGVLDGTRVRIEGPGGEVLRSRDDPRALFPHGRRALFWDRLDQAYFAGYALWNYATLPALLLRDDVEWREVGPSVLEARFPPALPTHCAVQRFHFDPATGRLRQHDYTADVFGSWARAAHVVLEHDEADGIVFTSRRRVTPRRRDGQPAPFPLLVGIELEDFRLA